MNLLIRAYITSFLAALALVACGGGNDVASSGATAVSAAAPVTTTVTPEAKINGQVDERTGIAPVAAQLTVWTVYSNGGCTNSITFASGCTNSQTNNVTSCGKGPALNQAQETACMNAVPSANQSQCSALGDQVLWTGGSCQYTTCAATGQNCNVPYIPPTAAPCLVSQTYGGTEPLLTATTDPTLAQCATLLVYIATGNPWNVYSNGGCGLSWNYGGNGYALSPHQFNACNSQ